MRYRWLSGSGPVNAHHHGCQHPFPARVVQDLCPVLIVAFIVNMAMGVKKNHSSISYGFLPFLRLENPANLYLHQSNQAVKI